MVRIQSESSQPSFKASPAGRPGFPLKRQSSFVGKPALDETDEVDVDDEVCTEHQTAPAAKSSAPPLALRTASVGSSASPRATPSGDRGNRGNLVLTSSEDAGTQETSDTDYEVRRGGPCLRLGSDKHGSRAADDESKETDTDNAHLHSRFILGKNTSGRTAFVNQSLCESDSSDDDDEDEELDGAVADAINTATPPPRESPGPASNFLAVDAISIDGSNFSMDQASDEYFEIGETGAQKL
jgi:hypothetical protein